MSALLLDTAVLIWWDSNDPVLGRGARAAIQDADEVWVSAASAWEIVIKTALGKLRSTRQPALSVTESGFRELAVTFEHVQAVGTLSSHHCDPFDRLIIAVAKVEGLTIVSSDAKFRLYDVPLIDALT